MKRLRQYLTRFFADNIPAPSSPAAESPALVIEYTTGCLDDLIGNRMLIWTRISKANNTAELDECSNLTYRLALTFPHLHETAYHVTQLHCRILHRRCELISAQYPVTE